MTATNKAYLQLHIAVFLWGFTAILGKMISLSALVLVFWRMLFTSISLILLFKVIDKIKQIPQKTILELMGTGVIVALHWLCFYGAIKLSNASVSLVCMATTAFFVSFFEPFLLKKPLKWFEILLSLLVVPGMYMIVNHLDIKMINGVWVGILAALLAAVFGTFNKRFVDNGIDTYVITFVELSSGCVFLGLLLPFFHSHDPNMSLIPTHEDIIYLLILALLCTVLPYILSLNAMKKLSAFTTILSINMEPVYGIAMAWFILHENQELSAGFYWGVVIIMLAVFGYPFFKKRFELAKKSSQ